MAFVSPSECLFVNNFLAIILQQSSPNFTEIFVDVRNRNQHFFGYLKNRSLSATLQASYHRILRSLRLISNDPKAPPLIFGGVLKKDAYLLVRRLLRGRMIEKIVRSQTPNNVLMATHPPIVPAKQLLAGHTEAPSPMQLRSGYFSRLQSYRHSVG